jgi:hypothetical protein
MLVLGHLAVLAATVLVLSRVLPSVRIRSAGTATVVAITFSVLNFLRGWLIRARSFVRAVFTLGLFFFVIPIVCGAVACGGKATGASGTPGRPVVLGLPDTCVDDLLPRQSDRLWLG